MVDQRTPEQRVREEKGIALGVMGCVGSLSVVGIGFLIYFFVSVLMGDEKPRTPEEEMRANADRVCEVAGGCD